MAIIDVSPGTLPMSAHRIQLRRAVIASTVGTTIEWYDFLLYSVVTTGDETGEVCFEARGSRSPLWV